MKKEDLKIIFFCSDIFGLYTLEQLVKFNYKILRIVTSHDCKQNKYIIDFAFKNHISLIKTGMTDYENEQLINAIKDLNANLFIVIAFKKLPESIWKIPVLGTINLHASLLPNYKGSAPINWAIINGETETGVTTFFINNKIDEGEIILQENYNININDDYYSLKEKLSYTNIIIFSIMKILIGKFNLTNSNNTFVKNFLAKKIRNSDCEIYWGWGVNYVYNFIRGLSNYGAYTYITNQKEKLIKIKIYKTSFINYDKFKIKENAFYTNVDNTKLYMCFVDERIFSNKKSGILSIDIIQKENGIKLNIEEFLRGFKLSKNIKILEKY